jgi:hypothetical protein
MPAASAACKVEQRGAAGPEPSVVRPNRRVAGGAIAGVEKLTWQLHAGRAQPIAGTAQQFGQCHSHGACWRAGRLGRRRCGRARERRRGGSLVARGPSRREKKTDDKERASQARTRGREGRMIPLPDGRQTESSL